MPAPDVVPEFVDTVDETVPAAWTSTLSSTMPAPRDAPFIVRAAVTMSGRRTNRRRPRDPADRVWLQPDRCGMARVLQCVVPGSVVLIRHRGRSALARELPAL